MSDAIRAAGFNPALWHGIPALLAEGWPGAKVLIQGCSNGSPQQSLGFIHHGFDAEDMERYHRYYSGINPWIATLQQLPVMRSSPSDETLPWWTFAEGEFYNDFLKPQQDSDHGVAIKLFDEPERFAWVGFQFGHGNAEKYNSELPRALQRLAPALHAALSLNREIATATAMVTVEQVIEAIPLPAVLVDKRGSIRAANSRVASSLNRGDIVRDDPNGRLRLTDPDAAASVLREIRKLCGAEASAASDIAIRSPEGRISAVLSVFPLALPALASHMAWLFAPERLALVLVRDLNAAPMIGEDALRRFFPLTAAEARLAVRLATGEAVAEASMALGIGRETAHTHLQAIFAKTGVHRQSQLVALLARLPAGTHFVAGA